MADLERDYYAPTEYVEEPTWYAQIDIDVVDKITGKRYNVVLNNYEIDPYQVSLYPIESEREVIRYIKDELDFIIFEDYLDTDPRFDDYPDFEDLEIKINDITADTIPER
jgi:hypothetical protein